MDFGSAFALSALLQSALQLSRLRNRTWTCRKRMRLKPSEDSPRHQEKYLTNMIIGAALIESLTIYTLIVFFIVLGKIG